MLEFDVHPETASFYDPSEDEEKEIEIEIREDPLTGKTSRIIDKPLQSAEERDISDVKKNGFCPFCPETIDEVGATDIKVLSGKKMKRDEAVLLANVTPYSEHSIVIRLTEEHYLPLADFKEEHFYDGLRLAQDYLKKMDLEKEASPLIIMNYLKPAGSSITHPHMQLLISDKLLDYQKRLIKHAERFYDENDENYWEVLLKEERGNERYIGKTGSFEWVSAFAPRGFNHVKGISTHNFTEFEGEDTEDLARGIVNVLEGYGDMDQTTFNFSIFIPVSQSKDRFATVIDMVTRTKLDRFYRADDFAMPKLMDEPYCNKKPEDLAEELKSCF
ncbi:MAG: hypothetical protein ACLFSM_08330 [Thermoplasmata archaeon]